MELKIKAAAYWMNDHHIFVRATNKVWRTRSNFFFFFKDSFCHAWNHWSHWYSQKKKNQCTLTIAMTNRYKSVDHSEFRLLFCSRYFAESNVKASHVIVPYRCFNSPRHFFTQVCELRRIWEKRQLTFERNKRQALAPKRAKKIITPKIGRFTSLLTDRRP